jgi:DNA polymerase III subunit gamma/tau
MMFGGPKGCGKTSLARITAMAVTCDDLVDGEPCGVCTSCESIVLESSLNVDEFDAATQGTVDRIRSIISDLEYGSVGGKPRVVILDEAQRLSKAAQDALLKSVEDRRFVVILCTTEPYKIGEAIRSRLEEYPISPPPEKDVVARLELICKAEGIPYDLDALSIVSNHNKCCPRTCLTSLDTLRTLGGVSVSIVTDLFRYNSMKTLADILSNVDSDPATAFEKLDDLFSHEGPTWVRDNIIAAISSSLRVAIGAKSTYPVPVNFFQFRGLQWGDLARSLGSLDKPTPHDIEASIISTGRAVVRTTVLDVPVLFIPVAPIPSVIEPVITGWKSPPAPPPAPPVVITDSAPPPAPPAPPAPRKPVLVELPARSLMVDGVNFTHDEKLTSLDHKVGFSTPPPTSTPLTADVDFDKLKIPIPEKEFSRGLIDRFKPPTS